jgi:tetratricopeptide (TPR) repeat protein
LAIGRYEEFLRRFGDDFAVRREYAGVLVSANRLRQATEQYQRLLARQPDNLELRVTLGDIYVARKEYRRAIAQYLRALEQAPENLETATRLARAFALDDNVARALEVYDRYLAQLRPGDENVPRTFGAFLLDIGRPDDALTFLQALRKQHPDDLDIIADLVRAYARLEERQKAFDVLKDLAAKAPRAIPVRQSLADTLYQSGDYELAGLVYAEILQIDPGNGFALVGAARVAVQLFQPEQACQILRSISPSAAVERVYRLTWAEYYQLVGEYVEAKQVYDDFLGKDPSDYEVRLALAALDEFIREYEKAKAEYSKIPPDVSLGRKTRLGLASTLHAQRFFQEATEVCKALLAENPSDGAAMAQLIRSLAKADHLDQAVALGRAFLQNNRRNEPASLSVRFALAKVLLDAGRYLDALQEYEALLSRPDGRVPAAYYGMARAAEKVGDLEKAHHALEAVTTLVGGDARNRLLLSDLLAGDNDDARAAEMAQAVLKWDTQNLAALIRLADAQQRLDRFTGHIDDVLQTTKTILALSPTNVRGRLALARSLAVAQQFQAAAAEYDRLIALDPSFTIPQREKARVLYSDHAFAASAVAYQQMQEPSADEKLQADLAAYAQREPRVQPMLDLLLRAGLPGKVLQAEACKVAAASADPDIQAGLQRIVADYQARVVEQTGAHLEGEAKSKKDIRNYEAIPVYKALIAAEPGNVEALFDLGQVYGALRQTHNEIGEYGDLLKVDPVHREGLVALDRTSLALQPQLRLNVDLFGQRGRDGLARIERTYYRTSVLLPCGDENEFVQFGFARAHYEPETTPNLDGNILFGRVQEKCGERLLLFSQLNYEDYPNRLSDRPTGEAGAEYDFSDLVHGRARAFLENVLENGESIRQDIYRTGLDLSAAVRPARCWDFGGTARFAYYSDVNYLGELYLVNNVFLTFPPKQLKFVLDTDLQSFAHPTIFSNPDHNILFGTIHPYFAPQHFAYYEARIEWTQWLSRDYFVHSNQCYYSLQYAIGADSNLATYNTFRALANCDVKPWLSVGVDAQQILSPVYDASAATAFLILRFPFRLWGW